MDIHLGGTGDGIELIRELKKEKELRVIYLTGYSDTATLERAKTTAPLAL